MADRNSKRRHSRLLHRNPSTESTDENAMGKSIREKRLKKPKERWLLTRKTWRYMADAGRKLIPEGVYNRPEDIPKIEAYFQEVCKREPNFLLWRKNSYPGALGFRPPKKRRERRKGGSCRKASSADEIQHMKAERPKDLAIPSISGGRFDIQKLKYDFLNKPHTPTTPTRSQFKPASPSSDISPTIGEKDDVAENQLLEMLEKYLRISNVEQPSVLPGPSADLNYQELVEKLQRHLMATTNPVPQAFVQPTRQQVHFEGDLVQKSLAETLSRYFSQYPNRNKVISDLLTDRKALEKLYFELRQAKGFRGARSGTHTNQGVPWSSNTLRSYNRKGETANGLYSSPPPLIEIQGESSESVYEDCGVQTDPLSDEALIQLEEEYKKALSEKEDELKDFSPGLQRRRSSVDNDDVSQSVSDTIKRYLRMARKKSVDGNKNDRFKRVNYDRNLRNIKAKGEITKPGDDDGLHKGCQTNDNWILNFKDLKFCDSGGNALTSSRHSVVETDNVDESEKSPTQPHSSFLSSSQHFLSNLLHGKHSTDKSSASATTPGGNMQKSKSSSSIMHQGSRLMAKKIFRSRSKSQTRPAPTQSNWTPQGACIWTSTSGKQVALSDTTLLQLNDIERKILQKVAIAKLQALNLGVAVKIPTDTVASAPQKPKRRAYLLKKKALTTGFFEANRKDGDKDKENAPSASGLVFGVPLSQCVENDRISRASSISIRNRELSVDESNLQRHTSRASFSSLLDCPRDEEIGSCESLMTRDRGIMGSISGLLDSISCGSTTDIVAATREEEPAVPNILTECVRYLETNGLHTVGIFRVSTSKKRVRQLREDFDCGKETSLGNDQCPHDVATLLKEFLRDLPDPLLCRDLYSAFVQTQKIRNRRLQLEALIHLIQLLPTPHRDTLWTLLNFLSIVVRYSENQTNSSGEILQGNKMDSNNLATVFAPNILHCRRPGGKEGQERPEDHIDVINVVRLLIDNNKTLFSVPAELLDEIYVHMMDSHPDILDHLLNKRISGTGDEYTDELDSESNSAPLTPTAPVSHMTIEHLIHTDSDGGSTPPEPRKTWSREKFLHETAATGGPNLGMRIRHKDRERPQRISKKRRDESATRRKREDDGGGGGVAMQIISRFRGPKEDEYGKLRSSSMDSNSLVQNDDPNVGCVVRFGEEVPTIDRRKSTPYVVDSHGAGVIKASLTIPVQTGSQVLSLNVDHTDIPFIEDGSASSFNLDSQRKTPEARRRYHSTSGSDSSVASTLQPITGTISLVQSYDSAVGSSATVSSPPLNTPSSISSSIPDAGSPPSWASSPPTSPDSSRVSVNYIPDDSSTLRISGVRNQKAVFKEAPPAQRASISAVPESKSIRQINQKNSPNKSSDGTKISNVARNVEKEQKFSPSIMSIGNAVLRSRTADFEKISKADSKTKNTSTNTTADKKKYTKRRYTDSKHLTRHIPDAEALEASTSSQNKEVSQIGPVYKRRELISSVPSK